MHYNGSMGTGLSVWKPLVHNNTTYLCFDMGAGEPEVKIIKVDESNWRLMPAVNIRFGYDNNDYNYGAIWTDGNGDGLLQDSEKRRIKYLPYIRNLRVMPDFTYIYDRYSLGTIAMLKVREWNGAGSPVYEDFPAKDFAPWPAFMLKSNGQSNAYVASHYFATEGVGYPLYTAVGMGDKGWGAPEEVHLLKFNADGTLAWRAGRNTKTKNYYDMNHTILPGEIWSAFKNTVGVVHECVVAADFNGGYNGRTDWTAFTYVWDKDGLWVGGLFDNPNTSVAPMTAYTQSSENGAGGLYEDPSNGTVYYYGGAENEVRIYKISGWDNWYRTNGTVVSGTTPPPTTTLRTPENPANTTNGLDYSYYEGTWSDIPDFNSLTAFKNGTVTSISLANRNRNDFYGFRFNGYISVPTDGEYTFYTTSDDGSRLYIGNTLVVDNGGSHGSIEKSGKIGLKAGKHSFSVTYFEDDGGEALSVSYSASNINKQVIPASVLYRNSTTTTPTPSEGTGLSATYYDNMDLTGSTMKRIDATVNFDWGNFAPTSSMGVDQFSVRWEGQIQALYSEPYTFHILSDDGVRLWVNGQQLINNWNRSHSETNGNITLTAGQKYSIKIEYFEDGGGAISKLYWSSARQAKQIIPKNYLYPLSSSNGRVGNDIETVKAENIQLYPNPAKGLLNIVFPYGADEVVEVSFIDNLSITRKTVQGVISKNTLTINLQELPTGIYIVRTRYRDQTNISKLIIH
ncbi:T9SS type A sorting domain-containing protein [Rhodocytophaga rosea]|uniref:T9SS type A sorting domain-containing protein n=1 Tax=Rhodocytophaga rosea TaxID=2704465 RepID=A0A6C0GCT6_9BACT|nr:PA14 domain-containing protein [Rhodocytophaga rosea]QHT65776.1 T9SS type A sorting domain-containing protein [Rhodocytophaga rosea]